jgi:hypothetical protein
VDRRTFCRWAGSLAAANVTGCASLLTPQPAFEIAAPQELPQPRMSPDAVVLEVAVVRFGSLAAVMTPEPSTRSGAKLPLPQPAAGMPSAEAPPLARAVDGQVEGCESSKSPEAQTGQAESEVVSSPAEKPQVVEQTPPPVVLDRRLEGGFWQSVDEQVLPVGLRAELRRNGFRAGLLRGSLPEELRRRLAEQRASAREIDPENEPDSLGSSVQRLQSRSGKRSKLLMGDTVASLSILTPENGRLSGRTFQAAQCLLSVKTYARGDGGADLEITPEVEHGEARQRWVGQSHEGSYRLDANRERWQLDKLRCRFSLAPGQTVVFSCMDPAVGAGASFFARDSRESGTRRVVLVRLAQTQVDELFTERPASAALTTPLE